MLGQLPTHLFRQAKLLEYDLAIECSESGQFRDVFAGASQFPLLSIPAWLFDDLPVRNDADRAQAEGPLFRAALLLAGSRFASDRVTDQDSFYGADRVALVQYLAELATLDFARAIPTQQAFWTEWPRLRADSVESALEVREQQALPDSGAEPETYLRSRWGRIAKVIATAALAVVGRDEIGPQVVELLEGLSTALQIRDDLVTLTRDLEHGAPTYPIAVIAQAAGIPLQPWPDTNEMLGAMIATDSLATIRGSALSRIQCSAGIARQLGLPTFSAYLEDASRVLEDRWTGRKEGKRHAVAAGRSHSNLDQALAMAEGFLLADRSFKEAWESHREGMFEADLVASHYPAGMVIEVLSTHGHDMAREIEEFQAFTVANEFRYFDHRFSGTDTDTLGVYLRLCRYLARGSAATADATGVLECLERNVRERAGVPVWLHGCAEPADERPPVLDLGEGCATVAAHLLLGLLSVESPDYQQVLEIGALDLFDRILQRGLGANVNYPPVYALGVFLKFIGQLEPKALSDEVARRAGDAKVALVDDLERSARANAGTAQSAALLTVACLDADRGELIDPAWISLVLRQQRFDGSWRGEPFFAAPNRGRSVTWYESAILTSAMCYDALVRSSGRA